MKKTKPVEVYKGKEGRGKGKWRWRVTAENGEIMSGSTEGYQNRKDCIASMARTFALLDMFLTALPVKQNEPAKRSR